MRLKSLLTICLLLAAVAMVACDKGSQEAQADASVGDAESDKKAPSEERAERAEPASPGAERARTEASSSARGVVTEEPPLDVSAFIGKDEIEDIFSRDVEPTRLVGREPSADYNALHFQPPQGKIYGVGVQFWKFDTAEEARERAVNLREQYIGVNAAPESAPAYGESTFVAERGGIRNYVFNVTDDAVNFTVAVSCGRKLCPENYDRIFKLVDHLQERILENSKDAAKAQR